MRYGKFRSNSRKSYEGSRFHGVSLRHHFDEKGSALEERDVHISPAAAIMRAELIQWLFNMSILSSGFEVNKYQ